VKALCYSSTDGFDDRAVREDLALGHPVMRRVCCDVGKAAPFFAVCDRRGLLRPHAEQDPSEFQVQR